MAPSIFEIRDFLMKHQAAIVHFSGCPKGVGEELYFPDDLKNAIANPSIGLCCSLLKPGDTRANTFGAVGIVLDVVEQSSVVAVSPHDCGSYIDPQTKKRVALDMHVTMEKCERSLSERVEHNEWILQDYQVKGIIVLKDRVVWHRWQEPYGIEGAEREISPAELAGLFPDRRLFSLDEGSFLARDEAAQWHRISVRQMYGW